MYMHTYTQTYIYTYTYIYTCTIHTYMYSHKHTHAYAHVCTDRKIYQQHLNVSSNIIDAHTHPYAYACIYTHIYIYTYVHNLQGVCSQMCITSVDHKGVTCYGLKGTWRGVTFTNDVSRNQRSIR